MKQKSIKLQSIFIGLLYGAMCGAPVLAEDIEIYTGATGAASGADANILFVLDTSGSMNGVIDNVPPDYVAGTIYPGCFEADRLYVEDNLLLNADKYCTDSNYDITTVNQFNVSAFKCGEAVDALTTSGHYIDRVAQYKTSSSTERRCTGRGWRRTCTNVTTTDSGWDRVTRIENDYLTEPVECKADMGVHGEATSDGQPYPTERSGQDGWKSGSSGAINWNRRGSAETVYSGNFLNQIVESGGLEVSTRLSVMQDALTDVINASTGVNVGLMRFSRDGEGGLVVTPMDSIDDDAHKTAFLLELDKMYHSGGTPLAESYYEAISYFQGDAVDYGSRSEVTQYIDPANSDDLEYSVDRYSHAGSRLSSTSSRYASPISDTCQKNFVVLLTDGQPSGDSPSSKLGNIGVSGGCSALGTSSCLEEIADSVASNDQSSMAGKQVISTFTIGLDIASAQTLLQGTADASKRESDTGEYYPATSAESLTSAFANIVTQVLDTDASFSSPAVSVNAFNRSTHLDDLFFTLFKPGDNRHWDGNLKKYKLTFYVDVNDGDGDGDRTERLPSITDMNVSPAIDEDTGFFADSAVSFWTDVTANGLNGLEVGPDGKDVEEGGATSGMTATRNVYTISGNFTETDGVFVPAVSDLTADVNALDKANDDVTNLLLDTTGTPEAVTGIPYRETLLDWATGQDVYDLNADGDTTDARPHMGDPLHAEPALVQYGVRTEGGATVPDMVAYVATNDGYLHAFDAYNGEELFSYVPQELLGHLTAAMENVGSEKLYGLDGNVVAWIKDVDGDGTVEAGEGDRVVLYFGMRRGGSDIYALDVTSRTEPELLWVIRGGFGDYEELGQTWSTVNVEKVKDGTTEKTVLVFGGGYNAAQDSASVRTPDAYGRAVFIADAETGERLWVGSALGDTGVSEMLYSIPARVKPLDISGDGFIDRLYAVDMGGQIFRFDINNINDASLASSITGGRIADLAGAGAADARRFYYPPDVALVDDPKGSYHGMVIASGYRAHPLDEAIHDRIYLIKDRNTGLLTSSGDYKYARDGDGAAMLGALTETNLHDATLNLAGAEGVTGTDETVKNAELAAIGNADGWYINLDDEDNPGTWVGEKGLAEPLIIEGMAVVTTYVPDFTVDLVSCLPKPGQGKVFFLDILDATPAYPASIDERPQRHVDLVRGGIPSSPNTIITEGGEPTLCIGTECMKADFGLGIRKTYWYEVN